MLAAADPAPGDLVAVRLPPGPAWRDLVTSIWEGGAALFPVDVRLPAPEAAGLVRRAGPTALLDEAGWSRLPDGKPVDPEVVAVIHTSGTAGIPKLAEFDRRAIDAAVASSAVALDAGPGEPWVCCLPPAHVGGLLVVLRGVLLGAPVAIHPRFDVEALRRERDVAYVSLVPTMLVRLLDARVDLSGFRAILVGGAAVPEPLRRRAEGAGATIVETYGQTESCGGVVYDGRPLPGTSVRLDPATHAIELAGPTLMRRYRSDGARPLSAFTPDGWLRTDDAGSLDRDGRLRVAGRLDDAIHSGGEKIWPQEVEAALATHPRVAEVAVAGRQDREWGQRVVAFVVPAEAGSPPTLADLRDHAAVSIARFKAPRELVLVAALPRTASGKVRRADLAALPEGVRTE